MRQKKEFRTTRKGHEDWAGSAVEVQSGVRLVMERITELAGDLLSRGQAGMAAQCTSDCTAGTKAVLEIGEQVMAKPLRGRKSQKKLSLKERWVFATWVGIDAKNN